MVAAAWAAMEGTFHNSGILLGKKVQILAGEKSLKQKHVQGTRINTLL